MDIPEEANQIFKELIKQIYMGETSFIKLYKHWLEQNKEQLMRIIEGKNDGNFVPSNVSEKKLWASNAKQGIEKLISMQQYTSIYQEIISILDNQIP